MTARGTERDKPRNPECKAAARADQPGLVCVEAATGAVTVLDCRVVAVTPVAWAPDGGALLYARPELAAPPTEPPRYQRELFRLHLSAAGGAGLPSGTREWLTFTPTLNPADQPVHESPAGFVGADTVLFRATLGAPTTSSLFRVAVNRAPLYGPADQIGTGLARLLEGAPAPTFFTRHPNAWQPLP